MKKTAAEISNLLIIIFEVISFAFLIRKNGGVTTGVFIYYTRLSNLLALIAGILVLIFILRHKSGILPKWLTILRYIATIMLSITFLISLFVLSPAVGSFYRMMIADQLKFHHLLCPLISIVSFIFFEKGEKLSIKDNFLSTLPTLVYGIIMLILNAAYVLRGPYPFLLVYEQPVWATILWVIGIYSGTFLIGYVLRVLNGSRRRD